MITACITLLVAALFTSASTTTVALLHNIAQLHVAMFNATAPTHDAPPRDAASDLPYLEALFAATRLWLHAWACTEALSFMSEECTRPHALLPRVMRVTARVQPALAALALLAFFPFLVTSSRRDIGGVEVGELPLPAMFNSARLFSAR